jgi:hypothetical protein
MITVLFALLKLVGCILLGGLITFLILVVIGLAQKITRLEKLAREIYTAGFWKAEGLSAHRSAELWTRFRDEFDIPPGTATQAGVGDYYGRRQ